MNYIVLFTLLFATLAFVSGLAFLIRYFMNGEATVLAISIGSILAGFGFIAIIIENKEF